MKRIAQTAMAFLLLLILCACGLSDEERRERAIAELNENSDLPFALTLPETELGDVGAYQQGGGWGCCSLENPDIYLTLSGYPDVMDPYHITGCHLRTARYSLFGLRVGDERARAREVLEPWGYRSVPGGSAWADACYEKDGITIQFDFREGKVFFIMVSVESTNIEGVVF